jgi:hypothetical protein
MKITIEVSRNSHRYTTLMDLLRRDHYQFSIEAENQALQQHLVMQAEGSDGVKGAAVASSAVGKGVRGRVCECSNRSISENTLFCTNCFGIV